MKTSMAKEKEEKVWTTADEMKFIDYMASDEKRGMAKKQPTIEERKQKLMAWIKTSTKRKWGRKIDIDKCHNHAVNLYAKLK